MQVNNDNLKLDETQLNRLFVYGTLMKGFWNHSRYLEGRISCIIPGKTQGLLYHLPQGYPAMLKGEGTVRGEIVEPVNRDLLRKLDGLEGYYGYGEDNLYVREIIDVFTDDGEMLCCWVYIYADGEYAQKRGIFIPDGDWRKFMQNRGYI